nr:hypothetical protein [Tanacetum cinerariifolium]
MAKETALCKSWCDVSENNIDGNSMKTNHESGTNDLDVYHKAYAEYKMMYKSDFTLEHCYNVLKDHPVSSGLNLNEKADKAVEETQEYRTMGRDRAKAKKKAADSSRGGSSSLVDLVADKFFNIKHKIMRKEGRATTVLYRVQESGVDSTVTFQSMYCRIIQDNVKVPLYKNNDYDYSKLMKPTHYVPVVSIPSKNTREER